MDNNNKFILPIQYINFNEIDNNIINNLQLQNKQFKENYNNHFSNEINIENKQDIFKNDENCLYDCILNPKNLFSKLTSFEQSKYYTTNKNYIYDTQNIIKNIKNYSDSFKKYELSESEEIIDVIKKIKNESNFIEKYQYLEIPFLLELNNNSSFLQILSIYNLFSPLLNLILPFLMLFLPFLIIIIQGKNINIENYISLLSESFRNNPIGKLCFNYSKSSIGEKCGLVVWSFLYLYQIYNSYFCCQKFYKIQIII